MIIIRLSAEDEKLITRAQALGELQGIRQLVLDRCAQSRLMKEMGTEPKMRNDKFRWKEALAVAKEVLGDDVTFPKITDYRWYQRVNGAIMHDGMDAEFVMKLSTYAKEHMRMPIKFEFMICMHDRIMKGEYDNQKSKLEGVASVVASSLGPELPAE